MTDKQRDLIRYIEDHGQQAHECYVCNDDQHLTVGSHDQHGREHWECIPALWTRVRDWLGY